MPIKSVPGMAAKFAARFGAKQKTTWGGLVKAKAKRRPILAGMAASGIKQAIAKHRAAMGKPVLRPGVPRPPARDRISAATEQSSGFGAKAPMKKRGY